MIMLTVALVGALVTARAVGTDDALRGRPLVTRVGQPFCPDPNDLHSFFVASMVGDEAIGANHEICSVFHRERKAVVIRTLRGRNLLQVKVKVGERSITGFTTRVGLKAPRRLLPVPGRGTIAQAHTGPG